MDLDYVYSTLSNHDGENPLDYEAFLGNPAKFTVVACDARDGSTKYFTRSDMGYESIDPIKASSSVPVANEPYVIDGVPYYDGGIADPVPVQKAVDDGCDRIVVVLTRLKDELREQKKDVAPRARAQASVSGGRRTLAQPVQDLQRRGGAGQGVREAGHRADSGPRRPCAD